MGWLQLLILTFDKSPTALLELYVCSDPESGLVVSHSSHTVAAHRVESVTVGNVVVHHLYSVRVCRCVAPSVLATNSGGAAIKLDHSSLKRTPNYD